MESKEKFRFQFLRSKNAMNARYFDIRSKSTLRLLYESSVVGELRNYLEMVVKQNVFHRSVLSCRYKSMFKYPQIQNASKYK